jgi:hypothetical protein
MQALQYIHYDALRLSYSSCEEGRNSKNFVAAFRGNSAEKHRQLTVKTLFITIAACSIS